MSLVELARYSTRVEADLARLNLEAEGIDAILFDAETSNFFGGVGFIMIRLMVLNEDLEVARGLLAGASLKAGAGPGRR